MVQGAEAFWALRLERPVELFLQSQQSLPVANWGGLPIGWKPVSKFDALRVGYSRAWNGVDWADDWWPSDVTAHVREQTGALRSNFGVPLGTVVGYATTRASTPWYVDRSTLDSLGCTRPQLANGTTKVFLIGHSRQ
jgi:hypothetical protein